MRHSFSSFLGHNPADPTFPWEEWHCQAYIVQQSRKIGFIVTADMAEGKRNPGKAKAMGLLAGHPDLSFWISRGRVILIELKMLKKGVVSEAQREHHKLLQDLGHIVHVVFCSCPADGWDKCWRILQKY